MASPIHEGPGVGQDAEAEQSPDLAGNSESSPLAEHLSPAGLTANQSDVSAALSPSAPVIERIYRHSLPVRIGHWCNVICLFILIMSGLQIFNAHPALYWGDRSDRDRPLLSIRAGRAGDGKMRGVTTILGYQFDTTGVLGYSNHSIRAFPNWATIPSAKWLAMGRQWHLFFAWLFVINGLLYATCAILSRHVAKDLAPSGRDLKGIGRSIKNHLLFRHPKGDEATRYNVLQKIAYLGCC